MNNTNPMNPMGQSREQIKQSLRQEMANLETRRSILARRLTAMINLRDARLEAGDFMSASPSSGIAYDYITRFAESNAKLYIAEAALLTVTITEMQEEWSMIISHLDKLRETLAVVESGIILPGFINPLQN